MDATIRSRSAILAVLIHAAIFLILLFTLMTTTIPPFPETGGGGGVLVSIGTVDEASGNIQPMSSTISNFPDQVKEKPPLASDENVATQTSEESPISKPDKPIKKNIKPVKTETKPVVKPKVEPVRTADPHAIYQGKPTASNSQGTGNGKGDQGDPKGDPLSKYTGKNGKGSGGPGTGGGEGDGNGPGKGGGGGVPFSLTGRHMVVTPQINDRSQEAGKVVVDITVDKAGNVAAAIPGGRGSTTTSSLLFRLAKEAAMKAKFNASPDDAEIQRGTITFVFLVQ